MCKCLVHNTAYLYNVAVATVSKLVEKVDVLHPFLSCVTFLTWRTRVQFGCPTVSKPIQIQSLLTITLCGPVGACNCAIVIVVMMMITVCVCGEGCFLCYRLLLVPLLYLQPYLSYPWYKLGGLFIPLITFDTICQQGMTDFQLLLSFTSPLHVRLNTRTAPRYAATVVREKTWELPINSSELPDKYTIRVQLLIHRYRYRYVPHTGTGISKYAVAVVRENTWELPIKWLGLRCRPNLFSVNAIALAVVKEMETRGGW